MVKTSQVALLCALASCSEAKKSSDPAPVAKASAADALPIVQPKSVASSPLIGTWQTDLCQKGSAGEFSKSLLVFQGAVVIAASTYYSDDKCQTMTYTATLQGAYKVGDVSKEGVTHLDLLYSQKTATYPNPEATAKAVAAYTSGSSAVCTSSQSPLVNGDVIDLTPCLTDPASIFEYTAFKVSGSELRVAQSGSDSATSGKASGTRAVKIDDAALYTKQ